MHGKFWRAGALVLGMTMMSLTGEAGAADQPLYAGRIAEFDGKTADEKLQLLVDREEIRDLIAAYAHRVANGGTSVADLFTDDGAFLNRSPGVLLTEVRGREALDKYYGALQGTPGIALPMIHNYLISVRGNDATGIASIEVRIANDGVSMIASGNYKDVFRRENGRWKFVVRDCTFFHNVPLHQGWAEEPPGK